VSDEFVIIRHASHAKDIEGLRCIGVRRPEGLRNRADTPHHLSSRPVKRRPDSGPALFSSSS
jgi:hypothetical protein